MSFQISIHSVVCVFPIMHTFIQWLWSYLRQNSTGSGFGIRQWYWSNFKDTFSFLKKENQTLRNDTSSEATWNIYAEHFLSLSGPDTISQGPQRESWLYGCGEGTGCQTGLIPSLYQFCLPTETPVFSSTFSVPTVPLSSNKARMAKFHRHISIWTLPNVSKQI